MAKKLILISDAEISHWEQLSQTKFNENKYSDTQLKYFDLFNEELAIAPMVERLKSLINISPHLADIYLFFFDYTTTDKLLRQRLVDLAVMVGKISLGKDYNAFMGEFWSFMETRPYMRARYQQAKWQWQNGQSENAINNFEYMIYKLCPNDNMGVRYELSCYYLILKRFKDFDRLVKKYKDEAMFLFDIGRSFSEFCKYGKTDKCLGYLTEMHKYQPFTLKILAKEKIAPAQLNIEMYARKSKEEVYAHYHFIEPILKSNPNFWQVLKDVKF